MTKCFVLLILFIFNFSATVFADSTHFDLPSVSNEQVCHGSHVTKESTTKDSNEHCANHDCCHQNHVHYYLLPLELVTLGTVSTDYRFPEYIHSFVFNYLEIIKPPLV